MKSLILSSVFVTLASAVCHHNTHLWARAGDSAKPKFGYTGENGPLFWHTLDKEWEKCGSGKQQSPINIVPDAEYIETVKGGDLKFQLREWPQGAELENLGTTIEVKDGTGSIERDGKEYKLVQFHFHTTSEHTLEEEAYILEVHFVFQAEDKSLSVVGIPVEIADTKNIPSPFMTGVLETADKIPDQDNHTNTYPLISKEIVDHVSKSDVYQYAGSLTTPPCTEGVKWNVVKEPLYVMPSSYRKAKEVMKFNARYTQAAPAVESPFDLEAMEGPAAES